MSRQFALTTSDNPFSPITQWDEWLAFDLYNGYNTCGYLGRIAKTGEGISDSINDQLIEDAIDDIVRRNLIFLETNGKVSYLKVEETAN